MLTVGRLCSVFANACRLSFGRRQRAIGVDIASRGELQFCRSVIHELARRQPNIGFYLFHHEDTQAAFADEFPYLAQRAFHLPFRILWWPCFRKLDLFITTEQFTPGPRDVYTLTLFHGQPSKGVTFELPVSDVLSANDALFMYGPLQRQALDEYLTFRNRKLPAHVELFEIGYTKSDALLNGSLNRTALMAERGLDRHKKTVLYAPAFNAGASLREHGLEIIEALCSMKHLNVLAKLPIDCLQHVSNNVATGGVDWFKAIGQIETVHANFRLERNLEIDEALACADILVTCVSSVGFEFLALKRPVIYFDTPAFFSRTLATFFPGCDLSAWAERTTVNGGRVFGPVVSNCGELRNAIDDVLSRPGVYPKESDRLPGFLLYNPGSATTKAVETIEGLLARKARSHRPPEALTILHEMSGFNRLRDLPRRALRRILKHATRYVTDRLARHGYAIRRTGLGFIDARTTIAAARKAGLSVCDYRESLESDPRKRGRRDEIIRRMFDAGVIPQAGRICEIGPGTGQYLEKVLDLVKPLAYEVYETDPEWAGFLRQHYSHGTQLIVHAADGCSLTQTASESCDLVHAHAVFVYLPLLTVMAYLKECVRVCRPGAYLAFDCFTDHNLTLAQADAWLKGEDRFPIAVPIALLKEFAQAEMLEMLHTFPMVYGPGTVDYFIFQKSRLRPFPNRMRYSC
jgi:SAM-dependent methyltransferase